MNAFTWTYNGVEYRVLFADINDAQAAYQLPGINGVRGFERDVPGYEDGVPVESGRIVSEIKAKFSVR